MKPKQGNLVISSIDSFFKYIYIYMCVCVCVCVRERNLISNFFLIVKT